MKIRDCCVFRINNAKTHDEFTCCICDTQWWKRTVTEIDDPKLARTELIPGEDNMITMRTTISGSAASEYEIWTDEPWEEEE